VVVFQPGPAVRMGYAWAEVNDFVMAASSHLVEHLIALAPSGQQAMALLALLFRLGILS